MNKADKYDWANPGDDGEYRCIPVRDLKIDHSYQRAEVSDRLLLAIARDFKWSLFGVLSVMERASGALYVVDGQQRLAAVKQRGDIEKVPCMVYRASARTDEPLTFIGINTSRTKVSAVDKFTAAARANIQPAKDIAEWLQEQGLAVTKNGNDPHGVAFAQVLTRTWTRNAATAKEALTIQREISPEQPAVGMLHLGIDYLLRDDIPVRGEIPKLISEGGRERMMGAIRNEMRHSNKNDNDLVCALGILSVINFRRKNRKYRLSSDE